MAPRAEATANNGVPASSSSSAALPRTSQGTTASYAIYPTDSVQDVADSLGLPPLRDSVASLLAADVEYRIRQVIQDASKFMRHGKRTQLRVADLDRALRQRNIEPIFGFHPTTLGKASVSGAYPTPVGSTFRRIQTQAGPIHVAADEEIDLEKVLDTAPKVALSPGVGWSAHWLAVEGVQPAIPQNPASVAQTNAALVQGTGSTVAASASMVQPGGASAFLNTPTTGLAGAKPGQPVAKPLIKHVLSRELQLYFERLTSAILDPPADANVAVAASSGSKEGATTAPDAVTADGDTEMTAADSNKEVPASSKPAASKPTLSTSSGNTVRDAALASLRGDPGLHQLVPYLIQWINEKVNNGLGQEAILSAMLHTIDALSTNPYLGIEPYVHQLLPCILSILLTTSLGSAQGSAQVYMLRSQAAAILHRLIGQYAPTYPTLKPRIVRTILAALDAGCSKAMRRALDQSMTAVDAPTPALDTADGAEEPTTATSAEGARGPRENVATKLGAAIGLRQLGAGSLRALLVVDQTASSTLPAACPLLRLGYWCEHYRQARADDPQATADVQLIVDEVRVALAEVATKLRGDVPVGQAVGRLEDEAVQARLGSFWCQALAQEAEAARGALALLSELQLAQSASSGTDASTGLPGR